MIDDGACISDICNRLDSVTMSRTYQLTLPTEVQQALEALSRNAGLSPEAVINKAVQDHLFVMQFRSLRKQLAARAAEQGIATDDDVLKHVS